MEISLFRQKKKTLEENLTRPLDPFLLFSFAVYRTESTKQIVMNYNSH